METIEEVRIKEYEDRPLGDVLAELEGYVKVGTKGSGFIYAAAVEDYDPDEVDEICYTQRKKAYENSKSHSKQGIKFPKTSVSDYMQDMLKKADGDYEQVKPTIKGYLHFVKDQMKKLSKRADLLKRYRERLEAFKPMLDRKVLMAYPATTEYDPPDTMILIVDGCEKGKYWTVGEQIEEGKDDAEED